jgi:prepilin-type N-terminal cleavage/methylation domain-containing protein
MRNRGQAGVTLMELLIAIVLLSVISVGMLFALRIGVNAYSKTQSKLMDNRRVAGAQRILEAELEGLMPVVAMCNAGAQPGIFGGTKAPFFQGQPDTMRLVSAFSLDGAWRGQPQILEIFVIPGAEGRGVRLVVNEIPYTGPVGAGKFCIAINKYIPAIPSPKSFVLADQLEFCRFSYLDQVPDGSQPAHWVPLFAGANWPKAIRVEMAPLTPDPSRLQPISLTAPIRIHRSPEVVYDDLQ